MQGPAPLLNVMTIPPGALPGNQRIVIDGVRGAIFEYPSGSNTLVSSWAASAGTDPFGNAYPAGFNIGSGAVFAGTDFVINSNGAFFYSGTPAAGNLVVSITQSGGTDPFGNVYLVNVTTYTNLGAFYIASNMQTGAVIFFTSVTEAGPWSQVGQFGASNTSLDMSSPSGGTAINIHSDNSLMEITCSTQIDFQTPLLTYTAPDSNVFAMGHKFFFLGSDQTINAVADTLLDSFQVNVVTGRFYTFHVLVAIVPNQTAGTATVDIHGPAVASGGSGFSFRNSGGTGENWTAGGLASGGVAMTNGQVTWMEFWGGMSFSANGTLSIQANTSAAVDTFAVKAGGGFQVWAM